MNDIIKKSLSILHTASIIYMTSDPNDITEDKRTPKGSDSFHTQLILKGLHGAKLSLLGIRREKERNRREKKGVR